MFTNIEGVYSMGWNELSDPDMRTANFEFFCDVYREGVYRREFASWEGLLPGSSSLVAKCIPVFVKVRRCIYSSGYPHTTTITLSSIVVSDFLPPLVMTSLLEQAPDWLMRREYPPKFRFFNLRGLRDSRRRIVFRVFALT